MGLRFTLVEQFDKNKFETNLENNNWIDCQSQIT